MKKFEKRFFKDILDYACSTESKSKPFHISRLQADILDKLLHLEKKSPKITVSNKILGAMIFCSSEATVRDGVIKLESAGFIKSFSTKTKNESGQFLTFRAININWDRFEEVYPYTVEFWENFKNQLNQVAKDEVNTTTPIEESTPELAPANPTESRTPIDVQTPELSQEIVPELIVEDEPKAINQDNPKIKRKPIMECIAISLMNKMESRYGSQISDDDYGKLADMLLDGRVISEYEADEQCQIFLKDPQPIDTTKSHLLKLVRSSGPLLGYRNLAEMENQINNGLINHPVQCALEISQRQERYKQQLN